MMGELEKLMRDINRYLINKRRNFPRLYLLSNEDLMEMVGSSNNEALLQRDMIKLFPGIRRM
jgi:dynein heavy chain 2